MRKNQSSSIRYYRVQNHARVAVAVHRYTQRYHAGDPDDDHEHCSRLLRSRLLRSHLSLLFKSPSPIVSPIRIAITNRLCYNGSLFMQTRSMLRRIHITISRLLYGAMSRDLEKRSIFRQEVTLIGTTTTRHRVRLSKRRNRAVRMHVLQPCSGRSMLRLSNHGTRLSISVAMGWLMGNVHYLLCFPRTTCKLLDIPSRTSPHS